MLMIFNALNSCTMYLNGFYCKKANSVKGSSTIVLLLRHSDRYDGQMLIKKSYGYNIDSKDKT